MASMSTASSRVKVDEEREKVDVEAAEHNDSNEVGAQQQQAYASFACCKREGNTLHVCGRRPRRRPFPCQWHIGPDWYGILATLTFWTAANVAVAAWIAQINPVISIIVAVFGVECIASICTVAFTDPGIVPRGTPHNPGNDSYTFCGICMVYRDNSTFHCQTCNCCIRDLDHHCPWTGKCIGEKNMPYFRVFLWSMAIDAVVLVLAIMLRNVGLD